VSFISARGIYCTQISEKMHSIPSNIEKEKEKENREQGQKKHVHIREVLAQKGLEKDVHIREVRFQQKSFRRISILFKFRGVH
jgi:hypothetical protein